MAEGFKGYAVNAYVEQVCQIVLETHEFITVSRSTSIGKAPTTQLAQKRYQEKLPVSVEAVDFAGKVLDWIMGLPERVGLDSMDDYCWRIYNVSRMTQISDRNLPVLASAVYSYQLDQTRQAFKKSRHFGSPGEWRTEFVLLHTQWDWCRPANDDEEAKMLHIHEFTNRQGNVLIWWAEKFLTYHETQVKINSWMELRYRIRGHASVYQGVKKTVIGNCVCLDYIPSNGTGCDYTTMIGLSDAPISAQHNYDVTLRSV